MIRFLQTQGPAKKIISERHSSRNLRRHGHHVYSRRSWVGFDWRPGKGVVAKVDWRRRYCPEVRQATHK